MNIESAVWILRIVSVVALLGIAGFLATPKGRLPLALRGVYKIMRRDRGENELVQNEGVSVWRRGLAFILVILAVIISAI